MSRYINTRIRLSADKTKWMVEGQNASTYDWDTLLSYPADRERSEELAKDAACKLAKDYSQKTRGLVVAFSSGGYEMASYLKGEPYKKT